MQFDDAWSQAEDPRNTLRIQQPSLRISEPSCRSLILGILGYLTDRFNTPILTWLEAHCTGMLKHQNVCGKEIMFLLPPESRSNFMTSEPQK